MIVKVTAKDIAEGIPHRCAACPLALALQRQTGEPWWVSPRSARPLNDSGLPFRPLPVQASRFVRCFDRGEPVKPFMFELPDP